MSGTQFIPVAGFEGELDVAFQAIYNERANQALGAVRGLTPSLTGRQRRAWSVEIDERGRSYLSTTSPFWHFLEYGTVNEPPIAPARGAVEAAGCRWKDSGPEKI